MCSLVNSTKYLRKKLYELISGFLSLSRREAERILSHTRRPATFYYQNMGNPVPSPQFFCEPKTSLKHNSLKTKNKRKPVWGSGEINNKSTKTLGCTAPENRTAKWVWYLLCLRTLCLGGWGEAQVQGDSLAGWRLKGWSLKTPKQLMMNQKS